MGCDASAILAFGVNLGENPEFPWGEEEFDKWYAEQKGVKAPEVEFSEASKPLYREYWEKCQGVNKSCPVEVRIHGSFDYPYYILAVRDTITRVDWGEVIMLNEVLAPVDSSAFLLFCKQYKISLPKNPWWIIAPFWG